LPRESCMMLAAGRTRTCVPVISRNRGQSTNKRHEKKLKPYGVWRGSWAGSHKLMAG